VRKNPKTFQKKKIKKEESTIDSFLPADLFEVEEKTKT